MCGALAIRPPSASKTAQEKSSRSLMLTECAVDCRRTPICSATDMNRLLKISSITGSAPVPTSARSGRGGGARQHQVTAVGHDGLPAGLDHGGSELLGDDGRAVHRVTGRQAGPREQVHLGPGPGGEHADPSPAPRRWLPERAGASAWCQRMLGAGDLDRDGLDDDRLVGHEEGEPAGVLGLERGGHLGQGAGRDDDRGVGAVVAQVHAVRGADLLRRHPLGLDLRAGVLVERLEDPRQRGDQAGGRAGPRRPARAWR